MQGARTLGDKGTKVMAARRGGPGRWDDDDDDYAPVYKGNRNYDSVGAKVGEAFSDLAVSVRKVADRVLDDGGCEAWSGVK